MEKSAEPGGSRINSFEFKTACAIFSSLIAETLRLTMHPVRRETHPFVVF